MSSQNIVIASNFTSEPLKDSLQFLLSELGVPCEIDFAPFNQIFQELLSPASLFRANTRGANIILFRIEDFVDANELTAEVTARLEENVSSLKTALGKAPEFSVPLLAIICPPSERITNDGSAAEVVGRLKNSLVRELEAVSNLSVFSAEDLLHDLEVSEFNDPRADKYGRIPYTMEFFAALGAFIARKVVAVSSEPYKVIVLDCDQTLWKGVVGEDGVDGIILDAPHLALQEFMAAQSDAGRLICLCSKNNESDVWEVFDSRAEMRLRREHIVASQINWNYKSENLKQLANDLQLGLNSFIFVDDDPAVCAEVEANCPEVLTLMLPQRTEEIPAFLRRTWAFDRAGTTKEDKERTRSYQQQIERQRLQESATSFGDFLASLELRCDIGEITEDQIPRVSQLSLRTNQFNSTTKRRSESDVRQYLSRENCRVWTVSIRDRFGDYGLVGTAFGEKIGERLHVDSLMLSCRALGRGIEHKMIAELGRAAKASACELVELEFTASAKNTPIRNFLEEIGRSFKEEMGDVTLYRFPAENAAETSFDPAQNVSASPAEDVQRSRPEPKQRPRSERNAAIVRIANEFKTADQILAAAKTVRAVNSVVRTDLVEPRTQSEQKLADIWTRTLGIDQIGVTEDFFQLGGDSLLAVSLFVEIEQAFGKHLPMTVLIESPTIEKMAESLSGDDSDRGLEYLVPLKPEGSRSPLFCMHAAGGNVLFYRDLAGELDADQPVYGLQARGVADKTQTAHENVSDMASEYLEEMRTVQPVGPYKLCGSSFGGLIAFEMACQLEANSEEVSLLALFDTYAPGYPKKKPDSFPLETKIRGFVGKADRFREQIGLIESPREKIQYFSKQIRKLRTRAKRKKAWTKNQFDIEYAKASGRELPADIRRNHLAIQKALDTYEPKVLEGQMTLFRASMQPAGVIFEPALGWTKYTTSEIVIREVSGSHGAVTVYPYAKHLARELSPFLKEEETFSGAAQSAAA
jgi:FkbH-like protein